MRIRLEGIPPSAWELLRELVRRFRYRCRLRNAGYHRESLRNTAGCLTFGSDRTLPSSEVPRVFGSNDLNLEAHWHRVGPYREKAPFVAKVAGARIFGNSFAVTSPKGELFEDLVWDSSELRRAIPPPVLPVRSISGLSVLLGLHRSRNYYHWLIECLPRLQWLKENFSTLRWIAPRMKSFHRESLQELGIPESQWIEFSPDQEILEAETLIVPSRIGANRKISIEGVGWLRERFVSKESRQKRKIFVTRGAAANRNISNEAAVKKILQDAGFEEITGDRLSFREQITIFSEASQVVGAHGAGMANAVFCAVGTPVLELMGDAYLNPCYAELAHSARLPYGLVIGKSDRAGNYEIDPEALRGGLSL